MYKIKISHETTGGGSIDTRMECVESDEGFDKGIWPHGNFINPHIIKFRSQTFEDLQENIDHWVSKATEEINRRRRNLTVKESEIIL